MAEEIQTAMNAIFDVLGADEELCALVGTFEAPRIHKEVAPQPEEGEDDADHFPLVLIRTLPSTDDTQNASADHIFSNLNFRVVAAASGLSFAGIAAIADMIFQLLHNRRFALPGNGGRVLTCRRLRPFRQTFLDNGKYYAWTGGDYLLRVN